MLNTGTYIISTMDIQDIHLILRGYEYSVEQTKIILESFPLFDLPKSK